MHKYDIRALDAIFELAYHENISLLDKLYFKQYKEKVMDTKFANHVKAFLLAHQVGEDQGGYLTKLEQIATMRLSEWDGKLPSAAKFKPDTKRVKVVESTKKKPIIPWWWYMDQDEPVPTVVEDIYKNLVFDFVIMYPQQSIWIYIIVEPEKKDLELILDQKNLRAFILMSLINKNYSPKERQDHRLRLGRIINSPDIRKIITFVAHSPEYDLKGAIPAHVPTLSSVDSARCTNWKIIYPGVKQIFAGFRDMVGDIFR